MHLITYISDYTMTEKSLKLDIDEICKISKKNNHINQITGVLFYTNGQFLQIIEGSKHNVDNLMRKIKNDPRHENIEILIDVPIEARGLQNWNMDSFDLGNMKNYNRDSIVKLTKDFQEILLPRSDVLIHYYKILLNSVHGVTAT